MKIIKPLTEEEYQLLIQVFDWGSDLVAEDDTVEDLESLSFKIYTAKEEE